MRLSAGDGVEAEGNGDLLWLFQDWERADMPAGQAEAEDSEFGATPTSRVE